MSSSVFFDASFTFASSDEPEVIQYIEDLARSPSEESVTDYSSATPPSIPLEGPTVVQTDVTTSSPCPTTLTNTEQRRVPKTGAKRTPKRTNRPTPYKGVDGKKTTEPQQQPSGFSNQNAQTRSERAQGCETLSYPKGAASPNIRTIRAAGRGKCDKMRLLNCNHTTSWGKGEQEQEQEQKEEEVQEEEEEPSIPLYPRGLRWVTAQKI